MGSMGVLSVVNDTYDWSHFYSYELVLIWSLICFLFKNLELCY